METRRKHAACRAKHATYLYAGLPCYTAARAASPPLRGSTELALGRQVGWPMMMASDAVLNSGNRSASLETWS